MTFTQINVFIEIVKFKNFTRVGEHLGMTQSAVSHAISGLERHLGVKLLHRSRSGLTLTQNGEIVYRRCLKIQENYNSIYSEIIQKKNLPTRTLKIGVLPSISVSLLPKIMKIFNQTYPQIEIILFEGTDNEIINWIKSKTIDIGFITLPNDQFDSTFIIQDEMHVVVSISNKLSNYKSLTVTQLLYEKFILSSSGCAPLIHKIFDSENVEPNINYKVSSLPTILEMVKEQVGITILPDLALRNYKSSAITHLPLRPNHYRNIGLGTSYSIDKDITLSAFVEVCNSIAQSFR